MEPRINKLTKLNCNIILYTLMNKYNYVNKVIDYRLNSRPGGKIFFFTAMSSLSIGTRGSISGENRARV
jgi:hypothetical protein